MTGVGGPWFEEQSVMLPSVNDFAVALRETDAFVETACPTR